MSFSADRSFVAHFQAEVHESYQRMGSKLRNTVRVKNNIKGATTTFQKVGKGTAGTKERHGAVPVMNLDHEPITIALRDYYAGDWIDALDELKLSIDEKMVTAHAGAYALGRKTDALIIDAFDSLPDSNDATGDDDDLLPSAGLTKAKVLKAFEMLGEKDIPDDGQRFAVIGWRQWSQLLDINEFSNAEYVGDDNLPWKGTQAKNWLGTIWMPHSGLSKSDAGIRKCYWFHRTALGHAIGQDVKTDVTWHGDRAAHFVNNMMSQGAGVIDADGIVRMSCFEG